VIFIHLNPLSFYGRPLGILVRRVLAQQGEQF